jgi:hypothetical protein
MSHGAEHGGGGGGGGGDIVTELTAAAETAAAPETNSILNLLTVFIAGILGSLGIDNLTAVGNE